MTEPATEKRFISDQKKFYWELKHNTCYWSKAFVKELGYSPKDKTTALSFFLDEIIHENYRDSFKNNFYNFLKYDVGFKQKVLLKNSDDSLSEFICKTHNIKAGFDIEKTKKFISFLKSKLNTPKKIRDDNFYYLETATMTSTGSWYIDFEKKKSYWDNITRKI